MIATNTLNLLTVDDYLAKERVAKVKHEYVGGYVYARPDEPNVHNSIGGAFLGATYARLRGGACQPFNSDTKVRIPFPSHTRFYYPDGMVVRESNDDDDEYQDRPVVIAEVLSPSTRRVDEMEKREAYLAIPTLTAYLLIETRRPKVVVYHRALDGFGFGAFAYEGLQAVIPLVAIGTELPLAELYDRVDFHAADDHDD